MLTRWAGNFRDFLLLTITKNLGVENNQDRAFTILLTLLFIFSEDKSDLDNRKDCFMYFLVSWLKTE